MAMLWLFCAALVSSCFAAVLKSPIPCKTPANACVIQAIEWFNQTSAIILTGDNKAYFTKDEGQTWTNFTKQTNTIVATRSDPPTMYFLRPSGANYSYTSDGGRTLLNATTPVGRAQIITFRPHHSQPGWILLTGCTQNNNKCSLYTSKDYGQTWKTSFSGTVFPDSSEHPAIWGNVTNKPDLIFIMLTTKNSMSAKFGYTEDYNKFTEIYSGALEFLLTRHYMWVIIEQSGKLALVSSSIRNDPSHLYKSKYITAHFPYDASYPEKDYYFLDDTTRSEYVAISRTNDKAYGDLYTSEFDGLSFDLTLPNVHRYQTDGPIYYDFHRVRGLGGIYIANIVVDTNAKVISRMSVITFDNGGEWRALQPPPKDMYKNAWPCTGMDYCSLHLQGEAGIEITGVAALRSHSNAIGLIVANGNVGLEMTDDKNQLSTFLSRDGGLTWTQIYPTATVFEFGDHGGVLVLAPYTPTDTLMYSFTQGITPFLASLAKFPVSITVTSIIAEPTGTGLNFIVTGDDTSSNHYLYSFSVADANIPICTDAEYEAFSPSNGISGTNCFMGQTTTYVRRKAAASCYNNRDTDVITTSVSCPCSFEDYECAINFSPSARNESDGFVCVANYVVDDCDQYSDSPRRTTGYQLVPDTQCTVKGGLDLLGEPIKCGKSKGKGAVIASVFIALFLVGSIATLIILYMKNERFRNWVLSFKKNNDASGVYKGIHEVDDDDDDNTV